jgi:hypothetical protein
MQMRLIKLLLLSIASLGAAAARADGLIIDNAGSAFSVPALDSISGFSGPQTATFGTLSTNVAGTVTYTYLGSEAGFVNGFGTGSTSFTAFLNQNAVYNQLQPSQAGSSISATVAAGQLNFGFATVYPASYSGSVSNGQTFGSGSATSFAIASGGVVNGKRFDYFLAYNDPFAGVADYNDMVIGVNFVAGVPEPKDYALLLTGLLVLAAALRLRRDKAQA